MKKLSAVLALVSACLAVIHAICMAGLLTGIFAFHLWFNILGRVFSVVFLLHALLAIYLVVFRSDSHGRIRYAKLNVGTIIQRASGLLLLILALLHPFHYFVTLPDGSTGLATPTLGLFVLEALLVIALCLHMAEAVPKALVTLKITRTEKRRIAAYRTSYLLFGVLFVALIVALSLYFFGGR